MQDLWKGFTSQTPAAHSTYNYCPTKVREAIKVLSCSARFNVFFLQGEPASSIFSGVGGGGDACAYKFIQTNVRGCAFFFSRKHIPMNS